MPPPNLPHENEVHIPPKKNPAGPLVGIIIIIFLLFIGAFYMWGEQINRQKANPAPYIPGDAVPAND